MMTDRMAKDHGNLCCDHSPFGAISIEINIFGEESDRRIWIE